jgi:hypothetical protein
MTKTTPMDCEMLNTLIYKAYGTEFLEMYLDSTLYGKINFEKINTNEVQLFM